MARDGEIQNRPLLHSMSDFLDIGGVKRAPSVLNTDDVKVVYVLGQVPQQYFSLGKDTGIVSVDGAVTLGKDVSGILSEGVSSPMFHNDNFDMEIVGLTAQLHYSLAGATTDNTLQLSLQISRWQRYGSFDENIIHWNLNWNTVATGKQDYIFAIGGYSRSDLTYVPPILPNLYIPAGDRLSIVIGRQTAAGSGNYPQDTTLQVWAHALMYPRQAQVPI